MGTLRGDNGGGERPQEGGGLPDLPPEWGTVIIPDDPAALADESTEIRRQFRRAAFRRRWRHRLRLPPEPARRTGEDSPGLAVPLLIMTIAVIATMISLFAVAWPGQDRRRVQSPPGAARSAEAPSLAQVSMADVSGAPVRLKDLVPAVVLLVDGCACDALITSTVDAVSASAPGSSAPMQRVSVVVVAGAVPALPSGLSQTVPVRALADPNHSIRAAVPSLGTERTSAAVLLTRDHAVLRAVPGTTSAADFRQEVARLW